MEVLLANNLDTFSFISLVILRKKFYNKDGDEKMKDKKKEQKQEVANEQETEEKVKQVIDKIRPYLQNDGGDVKFKRYENGVVYVSLIGACSNCPMATMTLQDGIENALLNEIPEVIKVVNED